MMMLKCIKQHDEYEFLKSVKLRVIRAKNVITCQRALRAYVLTCKRALRAHVLTCQRVLHTDLLRCLTCPRAHVPTCLQ